MFWRHRSVSETRNSLKTGSRKLETTNTNIVEMLILGTYIREKKRSWLPGVDVMITIFCDFWRKKWRFSTKHNVICARLPNYILKNII
jgi:hypothetical protein